MEEILGDIEAWMFMDEIPEDGSSTRGTKSENVGRCHA